MTAEKDYYDQLIELKKAVRAEREAEPESVKSRFSQFLLNDVGWYEARIKVDELIEDLGTLRIG